MAPRLEELTSEADAATPTPEGAPPQPGGNACDGVRLTPLPPLPLAVAGGGVPSGLTPALAQAVGPKVDWGSTQRWMAANAGAFAAYAAQEAVRYRAEGDEELLYNVVDTPGVGPAPSSAGPQDDLPEVQTPRATPVFGLPLHAVGW